MKIAHARSFITVLITASLAMPVWAQQSSSSDTQAPASQSSTQDAPKKPDSNPQDQKNKSQDVPGSTSREGAVKGTSNDRLFYTLPNFLTLEHAGNVPPLTTKQKFAVVTRGSFDPVIYPWYGFLSAIGQAQDSEPGYGQGWGGYGKRFGAAFADGTIENYVTGAILPTILRQDPRYFQAGAGTFRHRLFYSMSRNLITRADSGKKEFNYSEVVGGALSAAISTYSYHPTSKLFRTTTPGVLRFVPSDRTLTNTAKVWGTQYAYDTLTLVVKEFWPDIRRAISKKHSKPDGAQASSARP
ncbi:MAG TPA: hypothetical protein VFO39_10440 [Candidatus Sulfotelmatobacter sp.]|nr:hypothetical protein [Candidatus Sulfotelmatobacter sp.]